MTALSVMSRCDKLYIYASVDSDVRENQSNAINPTSTSAAVKAMI